MNKIVHPASTKLISIRTNDIPRNQAFYGRMMDPESKTWGKRLLYLHLGGYNLPEEMMTVSLEPRGQGNYPHTHRVIDKCKEVIDYEPVDITITVG